MVVVVVIFVRPSGGKTVGTKTKGAILNTARNVGGRGRGGGGDCVLN